MDKWCRCVGNLWRGDVVSVLGVLSRGDRSARAPKPAAEISSTTIPRSRLTRRAAATPVLEPRTARYGYLRDWATDESCPWKVIKSDYLRHMFADKSEHVTNRPCNGNRSGSRAPGPTILADTKFLDFVSGFHSGSQPARSLAPPGPSFGSLRVTVFREDDRISTPRPLTERP